MGTFPHINGIRYAIHFAEVPLKVILIALAANLFICVAKFAAWFFTRSSAVLAEAVHSLVDCSNQLLLMLGVRLSKREPNKQHPLGYGREDFFWSFIVAILLFSLGGLFAIYEGVHKLKIEESIGHPFIALGVIGVSLVLESISFKNCMHEIARENKYGSLYKWFRKTTSSHLLVVFTEDAAALIGLVIAAIFLTISWITGNPTWDAIGSIVIGSILVLVAVFLAIEIKSLIIGEAPGIDMKPAAQQIVNSVIPGATIFHFIAIQSSPEHVTVAMKISIGSITGAVELVEKINEIEEQMRVKFPEILWQFVEPDVRD
jgi:cation diffusion facilitator family transporter